MTVAYIDSSTLLAIALGERGWEPHAHRLDNLDQVTSSNLLEAELRAAFRCEGKSFPDHLVMNIEWILPDRPLGAEMERVLDVGYLKGADLWHVAVALSVVDDPNEITFVTLDDRQREVANELGFKT